MIKVYYEISKKKKEKFIPVIRKRASRSFVKGFTSLIFLWNTGVSYNFTDTGNSSRSIGMAGAGYQGFGGLFSIAPGSLLYGIVVGTGNTAVTPTQYALQTPVLEGTASGKLEYFGTKVGSVTISAPDGFFDIESILRNSSGGDIVVTEIALYGQTGYISGGAYPLMHLRDVLVSPVTVHNGDYLKVKYTLKITA